MMSAPEPEQPLDPKAAMKAALDAKRAQQKRGQDNLEGGSKASGGKSPMAKQRTFRRKSGG